VWVLTYAVLDQALKKHAAFPKRLGELSDDERRLLRGFSQLIDAVRGNKHQKLSDVARSLSEMRLPPPSLLEPMQLWETIKADPLDFVRAQLSNKVRRTSIILWRERAAQDLVAGIFCEGILDALCVLLLLRIGSGWCGKTGECVICRRLIWRERGDRRKTCSGKCRKRLSRRNRR
jgi:hypothetical protein